MSWACFTLPMLPLEAHPATAVGGAPARDGIIDYSNVDAAPAPLLQTQHTPDPTDTTPRAIHDGGAPRARIVCANASAQTAGVRPGLTLAQAQALLPGLRSHPRDTTAEATRLEHLGSLAYAFSSQVRLLPPNAVALEVGRSLNLFGGWDALQSDLRTRLADLHHHITLAAAPNALAARIFAPLQDGLTLHDDQQLRRALDSVRITHAQLDPDTVAALDRLGLRTLGDIGRLAPAALARRLGRPLLDTLDRLYGRAPDPAPLYLPPNRFERRFEFDYGIETSGALLFPLQRLARDFAAFLQARDGGVLRFVLQFDHDGQPPSRIEIGMRKPVRDFDALLDAVRGRLDRLQLPAPVEAATWIADELPPFVPERLDLFDTRTRGQLDLDTLADRLRSRLGDDAVRTVAVHADHRPERAWRASTQLPTTRTPRTPERATPTLPTAASTNTRNVAVSHLPPVDPPLRPLWLLPKPIPLRTRIVRLLDAHGERIESGWWDGDLRRDYFVADLDGGQRAWIFRAPDSTDGWMLHGWFA